MNVFRFAAALCALLLASFALPATAWNRSVATQFAALPPGTAHPEGITADARGNLYVANFDVSGNTSVGTIVVFDGRNGHTLRTLQVANGTPFLLGIAFNPVTGDLLVCDLDGQKVLKVDPQSGAASVFATIPGGNGGPNALAFDAAGNVYISDSFQATIWRTPPSGVPGGGPATAWVVDPLLGTTGVPPFGANGLAFNRAGTNLFVANTGNDTIVRIPVLAGGSAGTPEVFVNSINGADGLIIDGSDNLWVAANQADEIVVVDPTGRVIAKLGDFDGIDRQGAPIGLLFPASLVMVGNFIYVTNLSLDLHAATGLPQAVDTQWAAQVTQHTIARIHAHLPPVRGL